MLKNTDQGSSCRNVLKNWCVFFIVTVHLTFPHTLSHFIFITPFKVSIIFPMFLNGRSKSQKVYLWLQCYQTQIFQFWTPCSFYDTDPLTDLPDSASAPLQLIVNTTNKGLLKSINLIMSFPVDSHYIQVKSNSLTMACHDCAPHFLCCLIFPPPSLLLCDSTYTLIFNPLFSTWDFVPFLFLIYFISVSESSQLIMEMMGKELLSDLFNS